MKDALNALLISAAFATVSTALFATGSGSIFRYLGFYVGMLAFWILPVAGYFLVRNIIHNRRLRVENADTAELPVPDTQPLDRK